jgi:S-adenosylmethionine:tRNA ribosyltransferase-isomerase
MLYFKKNMGIDYNYNLPKELIADTPKENREDARLFVYNTQTDTVTFAYVRDLPNILPKPSLLVLNNTKVVPARLHLKKETGGKIEILVLTNEFKSANVLIPFIVDRKVIEGQKIFFPDGAYFEVVQQEEQIFYCKPSFPIEDLYAYLNRFGETPLPHYIHSHLTENEARTRYQTVYAQKLGSIAAPTASLHFTKDLLEKLEGNGVAQTYVTLHVGMGTFAPISDKNFQTKTLHKELYEIDFRSAQNISDAKDKKMLVIAVGTTVARTLESVARNNGGGITSKTGETNIFIFPPFDFKVIDILMTNFHLPNTSLMHLVQAFLEHKKAKRNVRELYEIAIQEKFRFFSFGDSMLIL